MKKVLLLLSIFVLSKVGYSQFPVIQYIGSDSTIVKSRGGLQGRFAPIPFTDTTSANLSRISQYPGALIYTSGVDKYWYRNSNAMAWIEFTSSGGSTVNIYNSNGVLTGDRNLDGTGFSLGFHTLSKFWTQSDTVDIELLSGGAKIFNIHNLTSTQDTTTYKPIVVDPVTGRVMQSSYWYGGTGGSGGSGIVSLGTSAYGLTIQNDSTYKADTIQLSTRLWRQKGIDSVQGNVTSGLALKLNLSDTASMLTNYVRRQELKDTAAAIRSAIGGGSGSVTSVGSGYGLSGGTITTTGTLLVDSATLSNHYLRRKDSLTASNLLGYVTRQVLADSMSAIATSYILNEITTGYDSLSYVEADTLKLKGLRVVAGSNATVTPTITGTTISYSISGNDTTSLSNRINLKLSIADTANMLLNYVRRQELKDTAAAIRSAIGGGSGSVTSVGSGYGLSGGPITTTGTLSLDSATVSTYYLRRKDSLTSSNLLGYVTRKVLADSMAAIATSYILNEVTTGYDSLSYVEADTLKLKGLRVVAGTNATVTPTITGTTISYSISGNDTTSLSNRINLKLSIADTANMLLNYVRRQELKDTAAAIRAAMGGGSGTVTSVATNTATGITGGTITATGTLAIDTVLISTRLWRQKGIDSVQANLALKVNISDTASMLTNYPRYTSFTAGRLALVNGSRSIYTSSKFNFSDASYPSFSIIGSDPLIYTGPSATLANNPAFGSGSGAVIYGGATYKGVQLVDQISGGIQMARFYNSSGTIYNNLNGLIISNTLSSPSNYQGSYTIQRTVPYAVTGLNYHGFTDQTDFRVGTNSFNSFGSFVTIGNNRTSQGHFAAFQSVWYKDSTNRMQAIYDFVSAVSEARAGTIDSLYRFKVFEATNTGATIVRQYGIQIDNLTAATTNIGAWIYNNVGIGPTAHTPSEKLYVDGNILNTGNIKTGDPGSGAGSWKLGTAVTTSGLTLNTTTYVEVSIGGTVYRLAVVDPPQP